MSALQIEMAQLLSEFRAEVVSPWLEFVGADSLEEAQALLDGKIV